MCRVDAGGNPMEGSRGPSRSRDRSRCNRSSGERSHSRHRHKDKHGDEQGSRHGHSRKHRHTHTRRHRSYSPRHRHGRSRSRSRARNSRERDMTDRAPQAFKGQRGTSTLASHKVDRKGGSSHHCRGWSPQARSVAHVRQQEDSQSNVCPWTPAEVSSKQHTFNISDEDDTGSYMNIKALLTTSGTLDCFAKPT